MSEYGKIKRISFLDIVENDFASLKNPHRIGYFIERKKDRIRLTDMKGDFWELYNDSKSKSRIIGNYLENLKKEKEGLG
jgi:hypothetical protein